MKIELLDWDDRGAALLEAMNAPEQMAHLGGPESAEKLKERQSRYLTYHQFGLCEMMLVALDGEVAGSVGYWETEWKGEAAYEAGWGVLPAYQGLGLGVSAIRLLMERLRPVAKHQYVFAFPTPANPGSNGICRKVGFELMGVEEAEYPKGVWAPHNVWRLDLRTFAPRTP